MMNSDKIFLAALSGLLHDIGKFGLRAGVGTTRIWDQEAQQDYRYKHALLTADFVEKYVPVQWRQAVKLAAGNHHRPLSKEDAIISLADRLSAGERADALQDESDRLVHPRQMLSIFCSLADENDLRAPEKLYLPLEPLRLESDILFPNQAMAGESVWQHYASLWSDFEQQVAELRDIHEGEGNLQICLHTLLLILQSYAWCIPSAYYRSLPDISLYDHSRMTAALAAVLTKARLSGEDLNQLLDVKSESDEPLALLVAGDLSGIQDFIYSITARGATSALRGRSLYIQLLTEALARLLLRELDLPITNIVYVGGGRFYLLAAADDITTLATVQRDISRIFLHHHGADLYLALAHCPLERNDFSGGRIGKIIQRLGEELDNNKNRRFGELDGELSMLFEPQGAGGSDAPVCQVCGQERPHTLEERRDGEPVGVRKCPLCRSFEELGDDLRRAQVMVLEDVEADMEPGSYGGYGDILHSLGMNVRFAEQYSRDLHSAGQQGAILALKDDILPQLSPSRSWATGRRYLVNVTPTISEEEIADLRAQGFSDMLPVAGSVKPFSVLSWQSSGINRLGVLRMDVDDLGRLVAQGLGDRATLSRIATLSFAINLYFEGWVEQIAQSVDGDQERLYSIYSGGDDLFFVGAWDAVAELAIKVRADLTPYAANHPAVHASAGIVLVGGKYPLYQAARDAGWAETQAKQLVWYRTGKEPKRKDALTFLGQSLPWQQIGLTDCDAGMDNAHQLMHLLVALMTDPDKNVPRSLLTRLSNLYDQYDAAARDARVRGLDRAQSGEAQVIWGPWMWRTFYSLSRLAKQSGLGDIVALRDRMQRDQFRSMEWIGLAVRWADLRLR